jgi:hypothetical protein
VRSAPRAVLGAQQALQAATLAGPPGGWLHQLLWAGCFAAQAALVASVCGALVVRPVLDALDASSVRSRSRCPVMAPALLCGPCPTMPFYVAPALSCPALACNNMQLHRVLCVQSSGGTDSQLGNSHRTKSWCNSYRSAEHRGAMWTVRLALPCAVSSEAHPAGVHAGPGRERQLARRLVQRARLGCPVSRQSGLSRRKPLCARQFCWPCSGQTRECAAWASLLKKLCSGVHGTCAGCFCDSSCLRDAGCVRVVTRACDVCPGLHTRAARSLVILQWQRDGSARISTFWVKRQPIH